MARWMVDRNAKNLVLLSRSGPRNDTARAFLEELRAKDVRVEAPPCDVTDEKAVRRVIEELSAMPPIKGCIQGSMVRNVGGISIQVFVTVLTPVLGRTLREPELQGVQYRRSM
jgi:short-subunit dehydrogenase